MSYSDKGIISEIKTIDIGVFKSLYLDMHPKLFAFSRKYIDDVEIARDIVQDIFIYFWENRDHLQINISVKAYLFQMLHNKCLNHIRNENTRLKYKNSIESKFKENELNFFDELQESHVSIYFKDIEDIFKKSVESLPEGCRRIFQLSRNEGLDNKTIADKLNISIRTVEHQNYRALIILKENLKDYLPLLLFLISK